MTMTDPWAPQRAAVRTALRDRGLTQAKVARDLGISQKYLSQILTGRTDGRLHVWVELANLLGMTWQLSPLDPVEETITWVREQLGLTIEPWQAARMRALLAEIPGPR